MNENKTAELLIKLRKSHNLTQNELAQELNVSYQAVSKWERGENLPDANLMLEIAKFYNITVDEILRGVLLPKDDVEAKEFKKNVLLFSGIALIILSVIPFLFLMNTNMFLGIAIIVGVSIIGSILVVLAGLMRIEKDDQNTPEFKRIQNIVYPLCAVIFFVLGMRFGLWYIAWVVFILGYVVTMFFKKN